MLYYIQNAIWQDKKKKISRIAASNFCELIKLNRATDNRQCWTQREVWLSGITRYAESDYSPFWGLI